MPKLNDTQSLLLSTASQRDSLNLYPLPGTLAKAGPRVTKAITSLIEAGLAEEREASAVDMISRTDGDLSFGIFATVAGLTAIGVDAGLGKGTESVPVPTMAASSDQPRTTKAASVLALLQREQGATLPELIAATGWLPHTTRAALTGLRKKGHAIAKAKRDDATCYRIEVMANA